jgi:hypothetical protein
MHCWLTVSSVIDCCPLTGPHACTRRCRSEEGEQAAAMSTLYRREVAPSDTVPCSRPTVLSVSHGPPHAARLASCPPSPPDHRCAGHCSRHSRSVPEANTAAEMRGRHVLDAHRDCSTATLLAVLVRPVLTAPPASCLSRLLLCAACHRGRISPPGAQLCSPPPGASLHPACAGLLTLPTATGLVTLALPSLRPQPCLFRRACHMHQCVGQCFVGHHADM